MSLFSKYAKLLPKQKSKEELDERYDNIQLEKGDLPAMLIAALLVFGPVVIVVILLMVVLPTLLIR